MGVGIVGLLVEVVGILTGGAVGCVVLVDPDEEHPRQTHPVPDTEVPPDAFTLNVQETVMS